MQLYKHCFCLSVFIWLVNCCTFAFNALFCQLLDKIWPLDSPLLFVFSVFCIVGTHRCIGKYKIDFPRFTISSWLIKELCFVLFLKFWSVSLCKKNSELREKKLILHEGHPCQKRWKWDVVTVGPAGIKLTQKEKPSRWSSTRWNKPLNTIFIQSEDPSDSNKVDVNPLGLTGAEISALKSPKIKRKVSKCIWKMRSLVPIVRDA